MLFGLKGFKPVLQKKKDKSFIFGAIRKQFLQLTPEEWVRQHLIYYLVQYKGYPINLLSVEHHFPYMRRFKRADLLCYSPRNKKTYLLVECKAVGRSLRSKDWAQLASYNHMIQADTIVLTNGTDQFIFQKNGASWKELKEIPVFFAKTDGTGNVNQPAWKV